MKFHIKTKGNYDFINITDNVQELITVSEINDGLVTIFGIGSTVAITTMEFELGLIHDIQKFFEKIAPYMGEYEHHTHGGDKNAAAHIKASIIGPSLTVPLEEGKLVLGTWQQIVLFDFNVQPRTREVIVKITDTK